MQKRQKKIQYFTNSIFYKFNISMKLKKLHNKLWWRTDMNQR